MVHGRSTRLTGSDSGGGEHLWRSRRRAVPGSRKCGDDRRPKGRGPDDPQNFGFTAGGGLTPTSFQLDDDSDGTLSNTRTFANLAPGTYSLSETVPAGWYQGRGDCDDGSPLTNIEVSSCETVTCTFTNANNYPRPGGGTPIRVPLVPEFKQCSSPDSTHIGPLDRPSCTSPTLESSELAMGSTGAGQGSARIDAIPGNAATPADEADMRIIASASDVRKKSDGTDYPGKVLLETALRVTDRGNDVAGVASATVQDTNFTVAVPCTTTTSTTVGSSCNITTTADSLAPGFVVEGRRSVIAAYSLLVKDLGPNGTGAAPGCDPYCGDGDEKVFLRQGVFTP